jgi:hypothetical protein
VIRYRQSNPVFSFNKIDISGLCIPLTLSISKPNVHLSKDLTYERMYGEPGEGYVRPFKFASPPPYKKRQLKEMDKQKEKAREIEKIKAWKPTSPHERESYR